MTAKELSDILSNEKITQFCVLITITGMKRDCGPGELIVTSWEVVSCTGLSDAETVTKHPTFTEAKIAYDAIAARLTPCSDVRLYAKDKQGYANCVLSCVCDVNGKVETRDRTSEL